MFQKFIDKLYEKWGSRDVVAMTRTQLLNTTQEFQVEELGLVDRKQVATEAAALLKNEILLMALNNVKRRLMTHIQEEAPTAEAIFLDRFSINGVNLVENELQSYAELDLQPDEKFDRYGAV